MNLLNINLGESVSTKKLSIQGQKRTFAVYRIPIDCLIYNKKMGGLLLIFPNLLTKEESFQRIIGRNLIILLRNILYIVILRR